MINQVQKNVIYSSAFSGIIAGMFLYFVFSYLLIPDKITLPISVTMSILCFGLTKYYSGSQEITISLYNENRSTHDLKNTSLDKPGVKNQIDNYNNIVSNTLFVVIYIGILIICTIFSEPNLDNVYVDWSLISLTDIIKLAAGISLSFFFPGYAAVLILFKGHKVDSLLRILLAYCISMLITGVTTYISAIYLDNGISETKILLISISILILITFFTRYQLHKITLIIKTTGFSIFSRQIFISLRTFFLSIKSNLSWCIVFCSLFGILTISTYHLYGGITIGDQWDHQGRALLFLSGQFGKSVLPNAGEIIYPPLQSAMLAGLTAVSGIPLVNTYISIAFLNIIAIFAFYFFCRTWFDRNNKRASVIGSTLFLLSGGFGWLYLLYSSGIYPITSDASSIALFVQERIRYSDIILSANFMIAAFPDFSTGLIYIALPAGFLLLGLIHISIKNKFSYTLSLLIISLLGTLFHDEFYIFIIIASLLPLFFNLKGKNGVYVAFLASFALVYVVDIISPVKYFSTREIWGIPLINLGILFVMMTWALYAAQQNLRLLPSRENLSKLIGRLNPSQETIVVVTKIALVGVVTFVIALSFIVWSQLPSRYVQAHTAGYNNPWYLYPMRLGLVGIFGLAYLISYMLRKFEKEVFVFGVVVVIAVITGPYYFEHRFSKYIMVGLIGFASLLIFKLLLFLGKRHPIVKGVVISLIVLGAAGSTLMYLGYTSLVLESHDYDSALGRRNFPSTQEMSLLEVMRNKIYANSSSYNVASLPEEYDVRHGGVITKLRSFSGLPYSKIVQSPLTLNTSTLGGFYDLLESTNTRYIAIPHNSINDTLLSSPTRFAINNFKPLYHDNQYLILEVPSLTGPSIDPGTGVAITSDIAAPSHFTDNAKNTTATNNKNLTLNQTESFTFSPNDQKNLGKINWSKNVTQNDLNYIETKFRIPNKDDHGNGNFDLTWAEKQGDYSVSFSRNGLELKQFSIDGNNSYTHTTTEVENKKGIWYQLKIESLKDSVNVYLDNILKIRAKKISSQESEPGIKSLRINSESNIDFKSILIGKIPSQEKFYIEKNQYDFYYPLSSLALSKSIYDVFAYNDFSVFSKNKIVIPSDPTSWDNATINNYIQYAKSGGTLAVINSDDNLNGLFSNFLSIMPNSSNAKQSTQFSSIASQDGEHVLNVSGSVKNVVLNSSADLKILSSYVDENNKPVAPFVIEKTFPTEGKIIFVNSRAYFDAINNNPIQYFETLSKFPKLLGITEQIQLTQSIAQSTEPTKRFLGSVKISGNTLLNGSSFSIPDNSMHVYPVSVKDILISDKDGNLKNDLKKASILSLKLYGQYNVTINSSGKLTLPGPSSQGDYIGMLLSKGFDVQVKLAGDKYSRAEIVTKDEGKNNTIVVSNESKIELHDVKSSLPSKSLPILMKKPRITVDGNVSFTDASFWGRSPNSYTQLKADGKVNAQFDFVDKFENQNDHGTRTRYVTYLQSAQIDGTTEKEIGLKLPGDIPSNAKKQGLDIPLIETLKSPINILVLISITCVTMILSKLFWGKIL